MKSLFLALCIVLGFSIALPPVAHADDMAKAMDMVCQTAKPWRAVQGLSHDASALNLLTAMTQGVRIAPELVDEWARRWDRTYADDQASAIRWCESQMGAAKNEGAWKYWAQQMMQLEDGDLRYLDRDPSGVDPDRMRQWAYCWRFYGQSKEPSDVIVVPGAAATWGRVKTNYR